VFVVCVCVCCVCVCACVCVCMCELWMCVLDACAWVYVSVQFVLSYYLYTLSHVSLCYAYVCVRACVSPI